MERIVTEEMAMDETPQEYTQYLDPKYAEQLMSETIPDEDLPSNSLHRKGQAVEPGGEVAGSLKDR